MHIVSHPHRIRRKRARILHDLIRKFQFNSKASLINKAYHTPKNLQGIRRKRGEVDHILIIFLVSPNFGDSNDVGELLLESRILAIEFATAVGVPVGSIGTILFRPFLDDFLCSSRFRNERFRDSGWPGLEINALQFLLEASRSALTGLR